MQIAVIGSGISGNLAARLLATAHDIELFESGDRVGGHAHTVPVNAYGCQTEADVAFMVFNRKTYPVFCRMLQELGIGTQDSDMSLSVRCFRSGLEFQGSSLNGLFAQRRNLFRPSFHRMLMDVARFNREAIAFCEQPIEGMLLGAFLDRLQLGRDFQEHYLIPMSAAIWSADPASLAGFPAKFILGFYRNHGLLQLRDRPQWLTVPRRSINYVQQLVSPLEDRVHLNSSVESVRRTNGGVSLHLRDGETREFDHVVFATHADQSLQLLADNNDLERQILRAFPYQPNEAILHTDERVLPTRKRAWASWNYHIPADSSDRVSVTYDLNRLQSLGLPGPLCLTLNPNIDIDESKILQRFSFAHPTFSLPSIEAQRRRSEISGKNGVSFCGAYWGYGFHEDGAQSAVAVAQEFGLSLDAIGKPIVGCHQPLTASKHRRVSNRQGHLASPQESARA